MKVIQGEHYINLYTGAWQVLKKIIPDAKYLVVGTNCLSLTAGIAFNCLREEKMNIKIVYYDEYGITNQWEDNTIYLVVTQSVNNLKEEWLKNDMVLFFEYSGQESNILTCSK
ncbi:hypothetical protein [Ureaplasma ceti]|uniref:Uncharacterized protein n=1 Tax=Ureaplasma ceti TaxID=3119530 RepID=A0ABP9UDV0_9BACT